MIEIHDAYKKALAAEAVFQAALDANPGALRYVRNQDNDGVHVERLAYYQAIDEWMEAMERSRR